MRRTSLFWAIALIALGVLLLLRESFDAWKDVSAGGLVLIALGTWLLFERAGHLHVFGTRSIVAIVLIALGVVILLRCRRRYP